MAEIQKFNISVNEEEIENGHLLYFSFPVQELSALQSCKLEVNCDTCCNSLPTSWTLTLIYKERKESNEFSLAATLTRTDARKDSAYAILLLTCLNASSRAVRFSEEICEKLMSAGDMIQGNIEKSASLVYALKISLRVKFCHRTKDFNPETSVSSHVKKTVRCLRA